MCGKPCIEKNPVVVCYVALGSNLGDSLAYLNKAIAALQAHRQISEITVSSFYKSKPHGPKYQPDYFNGVVRFITALAPKKLLDVLQDIEDDNKRVREGVVRWGARTLDLDMLFYSDEAIETKRLSVPHPRICERAFVLLPLQELQPDLKINNKLSIKDCLAGLSKADLNDIKRID